MFAASVISGECEDQETKLVSVEIWHLFWKPFWLWGKYNLSETSVF
jgi:hypothetical protein